MLYNQYISLQTTIYGAKIYTLFINIELIPCQFLFLLYSCIVMPKRSALELLEHYNQALIFSLPIKDRNFIEDLTKHDLLTGSFKANLEALSMNRERVSYFLDNAIKARLIVGDKTCFVNLLTVMNNSKYDSVKDLAKQIESEYDDDAMCKFIIYDSVNCYVCTHVQQFCNSKEVGDKYVPWCMVNLTIC